MLGHFEMMAKDSLGGAHVFGPECVCSDISHIVTSHTTLCGIIVNILQWRELRSNNLPGSRSYYVVARFQRRAIPSTAQAALSWSPLPPQRCCDGKDAQTGPYIEAAGGKEVLMGMRCSYHCIIATIKQLRSPLVLLPVWPRS